MEKKEYVTPSMRWRKIETSELLAGSEIVKPGEAGTEDSGNEDFGAKQNFGGSAWSDEDK